MFPKRGPLSQSSEAGRRPCRMVIGPLSNSTERQPRVHPGKGAQDRDGLACGKPLRSNDWRMGGASMLLMHTGRSLLRFGVHSSSH